MSDTTPQLIRGAYHYRGHVLPRVTSVLNVIAKPGLEAWRHKVGLEESRRISREATALGTRVHEACERAARALPHRYVDPDPKMDVFVQAYNDWLHDNVKQVLAVERFVWHDQHLYAGTADLVVLLNDGRRLLADLKTSNSLDGNYRLQTIAYADALAEMEEPVDGRLVLRLPTRDPGALYVHEYDDDVRDLAAWRAALRLYRWNERHKDAWKGKAARYGASPVDVPVPDLDDLYGEVE